jgi:hypothetical protein
VLLSNLKDNIEEHAVHSKNKNIRDLYRGINKFKNGYRHRPNFVKSKDGDLLADSSIILNKWKNCFPQVLNALRASDVRQRETQRPEPLVPKSSPSEFETDIANLKNFNSPCIDQILAEQIQIDGESLCSEVHEIIHYIWDKE